MAKFVAKGEGQLGPAERAKKVEDIIKSCGRLVAFGSTHQGAQQASHSSVIRSCRQCSASSSLDPIFQGV